MIRVTIDLLPYGDPKYVEKLAVADIWNTDETPRFDMYGYMMSEKGKLVGTNLTGDVLHRKNGKVWDLLLSVLADHSLKAEEKVVGVSEVT